MIVSKLKTVILASTLLSTVVLSVPAEARCRTSFSFGAFFGSPAPTIVVPVRPRREVIVVNTYPTPRPILSTRLADRPSMYDRRYLPGQPVRVSRGQMVQQFETVEYPSCETCLPTISSIYDCGEMVQLSDGSLWHITHGDRMMVKSWMVSDAILVNRDGQTFSLTNTCNNSSVRATIKCGPAVSNNPVPVCDVEPSETKYGVIQNVMVNDDMLMLADGSLWEVASYEHRKCMRWRKGEPVQIALSGNSVHPYQLTNANTRESVLASLR